MSVYALIVKQNDWSAPVMLLHWHNEMDDFFFWFLHQRFRIAVLKRGQWGLLMYINEMCSMVVFWSWFIIWLKLYQSDIRNCWCTPQSRCVVFFFFLFEARKIHFGVLTGPSATVNLLAWSKVFHVKFYLLSFWNVFGSTQLQWIHRHVW